jgi:hypothetical protein
MLLAALPSVSAAAQPADWAQFWTWYGAGRKPTLQTLAAEGVWGEGVSYSLLAQESRASKLGTVLPAGGGALVTVDDASMPTSVQGPSLYNYLASCLAPGYLPLDWTSYTREVASLQRPGLVAWTDDASLYERALFLREYVDGTGTRWLLGVTTCRSPGGCSGPGGSVAIDAPIAYSYWRQASRLAVTSTQAAASSRPACRAIWSDTDPTPPSVSIPSDEPQGGSCFATGEPGCSVNCGVGSTPSCLNGMPASDLGGVTSPGIPGLCRCE